MSLTDMAVFCSCREVYLYRGTLPPGETDGLLLNPDVHPESADCDPVLGFLLDQHGCSTGTCRSGDYYSAHHDHTELRVTSVTSKGNAGAEGGIISGIEPEGTAETKLWFTSICVTMYIPHNTGAICYTTAYCVIHFLSRNDRGNVTDFVQQVRM